MIQFKINEKPLSVKLNDEERLILKEAKRFLQQEKDSTALKMLAFYGWKVLQAPQNLYLKELISGNLRRNKRTGIIEVE